METLFTNPMIQATCATLVHSLWQGLIVALFAGLFLFSSGKATAAFRYNVLVGLLLVFCMAIAITFYLEMRSAERVAQLFPETGLQNSNHSSLVYQHAMQNSYPAEVMAFFTRHTETVILIWLTIVTLRCMHLLAGLYGMRILKLKKAIELSGYWNEKLNDLAAALRLKDQVMLLQSAAVKIPMVMGYFKPVILLPLGLISALPKEQIEAILLHELAHIRRNDFIANLLQHLLEILFFFNPAILWFSWLIKKERENCCDDLAVAAADNESVYMEALLSSTAFSTIAPSYAVGFNGGGGLLERVKRLAFKKNRSLNLPERMVLLFIVMLTFSFSILVLAAKPCIDTKFSASTHLNKPSLSGSESKTTIEPLKRRGKNGRAVQKYSALKQSGNQHGTDTIHAGSMHKSIGRQDQIETLNKVPVQQPSAEVIVGYGKIDTINTQLSPRHDNKNVAHQPDQTIYGQAVKPRPGAFNINILKNMLILLNGKETSFEELKAKGASTKDVHIFVDGTEAEKYGDKGKNGVAFITMK